MHICNELLSCSLFMLLHMMFKNITLFNMILLYDDDDGNDDGD